MPKEVLGFDVIYGKYISVCFVEDIRELARNASSRAKLHRKDAIAEDLHSDRTDKSCEAVDFWNALELEAISWLKANNTEQGFKEKCTNCGNYSTMTVYNHCCPSCGHEN